jgi:hypothetical protein
MNKEKLEQTPASPNGLLHRIVTALFGIPVWTEDSDGECRKRWANHQQNGTLITSGIVYFDKVVLNMDGSVRTKSYVIKWYPRKTIFNCNSGNMNSK